MLNLEKNKSISGFQDRCERELPLLDHISKFFVDRVDLSNTLIICVQHIVSTTCIMINHLFKLGLKSNNLFMIGKCYSSCPEAYQYLIKSGVAVASFSMDFDSHQSFDDDFDYKIEKFLITLSKVVNFVEFDRVILLDDGGHLLEKFHCFSNYLIGANVVGVEQTSSGYNRLSKTKLLFPIINVARSWVKLNYESKIITDIILSKLFERLNKLSPSPRNILIMGYGTLGKILCDVLQSKFFIYAYDIQAKYGEANNTNLNELLQKADLILGCTGETSIPASLYKFLKNGVILASVSSSDREFDAVHIRRNCLKTSNCHIDLSWNGINLLNSGFPINFDDNFVGIDPDNFQLTRGLIFTAINQAFLADRNTNSWVELDQSIQHEIADFWNKLGNNS